MERERNRKRRLELAFDGIETQIWGFSRLATAHGEKELDLGCVKTRYIIAIHANRLDSCFEGSLLFLWMGWKEVYKSHQKLFESKYVDNIEELTRAFFLFARRRSKSSGSLAILAVSAAAPSFV